MNMLPGEIVDIVTEDGISLVKVKLEAMTFTSIVLDTPAGSPYLVKGHAVSLLFKETEVIIAKPPAPAISVRNRIECTIKKLRPGKLLSELTLLFGGGGEKEYEIRSIITREACEQLELKQNDQIIALIKTNEVSLSA